LRGYSRSSDSSSLDSFIQPLVHAPAVIAIGLSTGGPRVLEQILPKFSADFPVPILIVQHMPSGFTAPLAQRLNSCSSITVKEATRGEIIHPATAYIAPAGLHMRVVSSRSDASPKISLDENPSDAVHIPAVDELMNSVAQFFQNRAIGVIMTGMGSDGAAGITAIYRQGGLTIGQDEASCAVYGMPRICAQLGVLNRVLPLSDIPYYLINATQRLMRADAQNVIHSHS
jgi:two-component system chemotaxis response regulator CheB